ncbi:hypothetical protein [Paraburkholderia antibiotica]|uniref:Uncharacterized protein n=1 Tax=Paraburkholderia antibiotica TaxID=2728839 RepID=A0A7X9X2E8_9BURK|nr:hypothetical protein [Paraburkholderia antibiotica]NML29802.1 hypothetical protein [Paraburkholderia antibiotica]
MEQDRPIRAHAVSTTTAATRAAGTTTRRFALLSVFALLAAGALAGCEQHGDGASSPVSAPAPSAAPAVAATRAVANGFNESPEAAPRAELPPDCAIYLAKIDACAAKVGVDTEAGHQLEESADEARRLWSHTGVPAAIDEMCRQSVASFAASAQELGCK